MSINIVAIELLRSNKYKQRIVRSKKKYNRKKMKAKDYGQ